MYQTFKYLYSHKNNYDWACIGWKILKYFWTEMIQNIALLKSCWLQITSTNVFNQLSNQTGKSLMNEHPWIISAIFLPIFSIIFYHLACFSIQYLITNSCIWGKTEKLYIMYLHHKTAATLLSMQNHKGDIIRKNMTMTFKNTDQKERWENIKDTDFVG